MDAIHGAALRERLSKIEIENPFVDQAAAAKALSAHVHALGLGRAPIRWVGSPPYIWGRLNKEYAHSGSWRKIVMRRNVLLGGAHHLDVRPPEQAVRELGVVDVDRALIHRVVGAWRTPRLIRLLSFDLDRISRRLVAPRHSTVDIDHEAAAESLLESIEVGVFAIGINTSGVIIAAPRPQLRFDESGRLHSWDGPAVSWPGVDELYYWRGVEMTPRQAEHPEGLTPKQVLGWANAERRRVVIERFGWDWLLEGLDMVELQQDDFGRLLRSKTPIDGERVTLVQVVNSTEEPDGTRRRYFLRVPPGMKTAREAVAWTFEIDEGRYAPKVET